MLLLLILCVVVGHEVLKVVVVFIAHLGLCFVFIVVLEDAGENVCDGLALWVSHCVDGSVCTFGEQLVLQPVAASVAAYDASHLPEFDFV